jgi:2-polyprenyl-3-methyl-5-hydroxy-6-metoxy-1,4-benzoquinol methylase
MDFDRKKHWETIYQTKNPSEVSWFQPTPEASLEFFRQYHVPKTAKIIDIGGGDSLLVDHLLRLGYEDITVLDISESSLEKARLRLKTEANKVKWIVQDITIFRPIEKYDFWHDRAAFHFLTDPTDISAYLDIAQKAIRPSGILVLGTFSETGPKKCSGIEIQQYSERSMSDLLQESFEKIKCISIDHKTPFDTIQNFIFCSFRKPVKD